MNKALVYHTISSPGDPMPAETSISPERFEAHLRWLAKRRDKVVPLKKFLSARESDNLLAVTFDDGLSGNIAAALPLLEEYNLPFTLFMVAGYIGEKGYLSAAELRELAAHPLATIGSRGIWHRPLTLLSDDEAMYEFSESKKRIESVTGRRTDFFAYPYGDCNGRIAYLCGKAGYRSAWTVCNSPASPFSRWRVPVTSRDSVLRLAAKLTPFYFPIKRWIGPGRVETVHENFVLQSYRQNQWS